MTFARKSLCLAALLLAATASVAFAAVINGNNSDNTIIATNSADTISAMDGDDTVWALKGNDTVNAGNDDDLVFGDGTCPADKHNMVGPSSLDDYCDTAETPTDGADTLNGDAGNDALFGQGNNDTINAGTGYDFAYGGTGDDKINGNNDSDALAGDGGKDTIDGGSSADAISGGSENDTLTGGTSSDVVSGDAGNDTIKVKDATKDYVYCGSGNDNVNADHIDDIDSDCETVTF